MPTQPTQPVVPADSDGDGVPDASDACPTEYAPGGNGCPAPPQPRRLRFSAHVTGVTDGDTIKVRRGFRRYTVRLIGIDTPETRKPGTPIECGGKEATSRMYRLGFTRPRDRDSDGLFDSKGGKGRRVTVTTDPTQDRRDAFGRLLAYVASARGSFAAAQLRAGWAGVYVFEDPFEQLARFQASRSLRTQLVTRRMGPLRRELPHPGGAMRRLCCLVAVTLAVVAFAGMAGTSASAAHPQLHRACTNTLLGHYYVGVGHVNCRFAVSSANPAR